MKRRADDRSKAGMHGADSGLNSNTLLSLAAVLLLLVMLPLNAVASSGWARQGHEPEREWGGRGGTEHGRYVLNFRDRNIGAQRGEPSVLFLKQELMRQYPGVDISDLRLYSVEVVAKTRFGRGAAQLWVGPEMSDLYQVAGRPRDFSSRNRYTFDRITIRNPSNRSWGPWQLHLKGNFVMRQIILVVAERPRPQYGRRGSNDGRINLQMRW